MLIFYVFSFLFFLNQSSDAAFSVSLCELLCPVFLSGCVQQFPDAILEWQPSLQLRLRSMELILVSRVKGARKPVQSQKAFLSWA